MTTKTTYAYENIIMKNLCFSDKKVAEFHSKAILFLLIAHHACEKARIKFLKCEMTCQTLAQD